MFGPRELACVTFRLFSDGTSSGEMHIYDAEGSSRGAQAVPVSEDIASLLASTQPKAEAEAAAAEPQTQDATGSVS